ncbi:MAG: V-type ATP synthase subunit A, partial [Candidatus Thiodiazotropha taylori]
EWWHENIDREWEKRRSQALGMLARDAELSRIVNLVGPEALSSAQRWVLEGAALIKEGVLQQSALDPVDTFSSPEKQFMLLDLILSVYDAGADLIELGVPVQELSEMSVLARLRRCKELYDSNQTDQLKAFREEALNDFKEIHSEYAQRGEQPA